MERDQYGEDDPQWSGYARVPAWYPVSILLGGAANNIAGGSVPLRPEPFVLRRITYATTGDVYPAIASSVPPAASTQGRAVLMQWEDEFTKFFGSREMLVSAAFGDSNGFLDLPRGIIFSGKQTLSVRLSRLFWPASTQAIETRWDFVFAGFSLIRGEYQSGSAG